MEITVGKIHKIFTKEYLICVKKNNHAEYVAIKQESRIKKTELIEFLPKYHKFNVTRPEIKPKEVKQLKK